MFYTLAKNNDLKICVFKLKKWKKLPFPENTIIKMMMDWN